MRFTGPLLAMLAAGATAHYLGLGLLSTIGLLILAALVCLVDLAYRIGHDVQIMKSRDKIVGALVEIRDALRARPQAPDLGQMIGQVLSSGLAQKTNPAPSNHPLASNPFAESFSMNPLRAPIEVQTVEGEPNLLRASGSLWSWNPDVALDRALDGPRCSVCVGITPYLKFQPSFGLPAKDATDDCMLGASGWLVCPTCGLTVALAGIGATVGGIRAAVDMAFRGRLGLPARRSA